MAALIAVYLACFRDYRKYLAKGERAMILIIAADRTQAQIIFRYVKAFLSSTKMLSKLVESEKTESIDLTNSVTLTVATSSYRSIRGFTAAAVIADEVAFWRSEADAANPATEVLRAIRPSLATIPDSILLCISSPWSRTGPLYDAYNRHWGKDDSDVLVWSAPTTLMNPTISQKTIARDYEEDPEAARAEWGAEFRSDLETFLSVDQIQAVTVQGRYEMPPMAQGIRYHAFVDPSGGRRDAAALAIAHLEEGRVILDLARRWKSPHDPSNVVREMAGLLNIYGVQRVVGDRYAGAWPSTEFSKNHVAYEPSLADKSRLYIDLLPLVLSQRVELLDNKHLVNELRSLERRARSAGRDLVDHAPHAHDDLANAVAGVVSMLGTKPTWTGSIGQLRI